MTPERRPDPRPKGIRAWAHVKHPGVRLFRRMMDGGSHYPSGFTSLGRNIEIGAGIASVFATDEEWRSLNALIDEAEARSSHSDVSADPEIERLRRQNHENAAMRDRENADLRSRVAEYERLMAEARERVKNWPEPWDETGKGPEAWWRHTSVNHKHEVAALIEAVRSDVSADLRAALVEAALPLEVIAGQDRQKPYRELSRDLIETINGAIAIVRAALAAPLTGADHE